MSHLRNITWETAHHFYESRDHGLSQRSGLRTTRAGDHRPVHESHLVQVLDSLGALQAPPDGVAGVIGGLRLGVQHCRRGRLGS